MIIEIKNQSNVSKLLEILVDEGKQFSVKYVPMTPVEMNSYVAIMSKYIIEVEDENKN